MQKKQKSLQSLLGFSFDNNELFSRSSMTTIIRALLEPVANQNATSLIFTRFKNKEGLEGLIRRLEYCNNVEIVDTTTPGVLIKDDYIELEFVIFTSARYNFALLWDYSEDSNKNYTKLFFLANSRRVNDVYEILQDNLQQNYREKFYLHKPERRENELLNEALSNVLKKLNNSIEENNFKENDSYIVDLTDDNDYDENIKEVSHEIKNQLSIIDVYLRVLEKNTNKNKNIDIIRKALSNINNELINLKTFEDDNIKELVMQDVLNESIQTFEEILKEKNNKIEYRGVSFDVCVFADENKLKSVINNLIKNAHEATEDDTIEIELNVENNCCKVKILNHGKAIEEKNQKYIFEKGFTTKKKGSGIGLYSCKNYIEKLNGSLSLIASNKDYTAFEIKLGMTL